MAAPALHTSIVEFLGNADTLLSVAALVFLRKNRLMKQFGFIALLLSVKVLTAAISLPLFWLVHHHVMNSRVGYHIYFYTYWSSFAIQSVLWLMVIYNMYKLAMEPLKGLQQLGMLVFRWAAAVSAVITIAMAFAPHLSAVTLLQNAVSQLQQTSSILTLCLLLFVTFAIRPMGLTYRSRIFGVSLGMGVLATTNLVASAWFTSNVMFGMYDVVNATISFGCTALWLTYFAVPEPERHIIVLPTTSPFLRWNQISLALGGNPGFVALGSVAPGAFAGAELEVMRRASVASMKMSEIKPDMSIAV